MHSLHGMIEQLMRENRRERDGYTYTVPSPDLYPFQWLWDSCFHAIILSHFDLAAAKAELRSACSRPLAGGLLPHIIYWESDTAVTNWGREMRGDVINAAWGVTGTSAITQPPLMARALADIYQLDNDVAFVRELYPIFATHYRALLTDRVLGAHQLAFIINPDESGEDNSPRFDAAQELPAVHTANESLDRRLDRMYQHAACNFHVASCTANHFAIADVPFNVILAEGLGHMAQFASLLGNGDDAAYFAASGTAVQQAIRNQLFHDGMWYAYDHNDEEHITVDTWAHFMPLYGGIATAAEAAVLVESWLLSEQHFWTEFPVPSTSLQEAAFDPTTGFWRGPVWMAPNWFIYKGLIRYGFHDVAYELREKTTALINQSGFREQYNPHTGAGIGATNFTWGGLVLDME